MTKKVVGLDLGGSTIKIAVIDESKTVLTNSVVQIASEVSQGPGHALERLEEAFQRALTLHALSESEVPAVGLCTPGPASRDGVISRVGNLRHPQWLDFPIRARLEQRLGRPVKYLNDGTAAGVGEYGIRSNCHSLALFALGTGLGASIVVEGRPIEGFTGGGGECGHVALPGELLGPYVTAANFRCGCGNSLCAESIVSLRGLVPLIRYHLSLPQYREHPLQGCQDLDAAAFSLLGQACMGESLAMDCFLAQAEALGLAMYQVVNVVDPEVFVISGGICETPEAFRLAFLDRVRKSFTARAMAQFQGLKIEAALLGDRAGAVGAAFFSLGATR